MSVKLEILDYVIGGKTSTVQMINNAEFAFTGGGWNVGQTACQGGNWYITANQAHHCVSNNAQTMQNDEDPSGNPLVLKEGQRYRVDYKIGNNATSGAGEGLWLHNHGVNNTHVFLNNTNGEYSTEWVQGGNTSSLSALRVSCGANFSGYLSYMRLYSLEDISWEESVIGEVDVTSHEDFPLALTFQISDVKDITSTSGTYSKKFKVPATKNNNKLFKHFYDPKSVTPSNIGGLKKCRILVNNLYSLNGLIKIIGAGGYGERAAYYDCVFYGNNMSWATQISELTLSDIDWGTNLDSGTPYLLNFYKVTGSGTTDTGWRQTNCESTPEHVVCPLVSYGDFNTSGEESTVQTLYTKTEYNQWKYGAAATTQTGYYGRNDNQTSYGTPLPECDWRPAVWVKNTIDKIFNVLGYSVSSSFMNTDTFKKLIWLLPNAKYYNTDERHKRYSFESKLGSSYTFYQYQSGVGTVSSNTFRFPHTGTYSSVPASGNISKSGWFEIDNASNESIYNYGCGSLGTCNPDATGGGVDWGVNTFGYRNSNGTFYAPEYGYYTIRVKNLTVKMSNFSTTATTTGSGGFHLHDVKLQCGIWVKTVGENNYAVNYPNAFRESNFLGDLGVSGVKQNTFSFSETIWLNKGDRVLPYAKAIWDLPSNHAAQLNGKYYKYDLELVTSQTRIDYLFNGENLQWGQTYDLASLINPEYKQLDFIKGVSHAFNLKISTDETSKIVYIEPFNDFYKQFSQAIDWTYKLDRSRETKYQPLKTGLKREVQFNYKEDNKDGKVAAMGEQYFNDIPDPFPHQEFLDDTFEKGLEVYENPFFSGTACGTDRDVEGANDGTNANPELNSAKNAYLWECNNSSVLQGRCDKGHSYKPRLLYYNRYSPNADYALGQTKQFRIQAWASHKKFVSANANATDNAAMDVYPQVTSYNRFDNTSPNLCYGNISVSHFDNNDPWGYGGEETVKGLYETYYNFMIEQFKAKPRLQVSFFDIKITDIVSLDFGKLVYVDGAYWRINRIIDYKPHQNTPTKVELIEWIDVGTFAALPPPVLSNSIVGEEPNPFVTQ